MTLHRVTPGHTGWAISTPDGGLLTIDGTPCTGLTRWEARQTLGLLGVPYTEG